MSFTILEGKPVPKAGKKIRGKYAEALLQMEKGQHIPHLTETEVAGFRHAAFRLNMKIVSERQSLDDYIIWRVK